MSFARNIIKNFISCKKMCSLSFVQSLNPINNKMEWKTVDVDYDYNQEIATSCYGDMLHDTERNRKFGEALAKAIKKFHDSGKKAHVLDIGTGTGLLSMLAVKHGADSVVACEAFSPMANCALKVLKDNNFLDKIKIVQCHSTSLTVGEGKDLPQKANILVSEVFDTELIGEGAINTFNHAFEHLLENDCIVIPSSGTVYAQIVESELALKWNKLEDWKSEGEILIKIPEKIRKCPGNGAVHDIQLSEFDQKHFKILSDAIPIFRFDWAKNKKIPKNRQKKSVIKSKCFGKAQVVFTWWDLNMDEDGEIVLSCAPVWEHPNVKDKISETNVKDLCKSLPWRDHWMQAVYFLRSETNVKENGELTLVSNHDEYSFWFDIESGNNLEIPRPICECSFHFLLSRTRIGAMNDARRRAKYLKALKAAISKNTVCIALSDVSLLGVLCGKLGAKKVFVLTENLSADTVTRMLSVENELTEVISARTEISEILSEVDPTDDVLIVSEPYFRNCILPWDNMAIWYMKEEIVEGLEGRWSIFPRKCRLRFCAVQFDNLWKIATPLKTCEGFSMKHFDDLIARAKRKAQNYTEAQPLWEYPCVALTDARTIFEFNMEEKVGTSELKEDGRVEFGVTGGCNGVALWMEYDLGEEFWMSFGPVGSMEVGKYVEWDINERQGVHLFSESTRVNSGDLLFYEGTFDPEEAEFSFNFHFGSNNSER